MVTGFLFSCVNDLENIKTIAYDPGSPDEIMRDLKVFYTDSGFARVEVYAQLAETYSTPEEIMKLKDGLEVRFFDENGEVVSVLTASYGEIKNKQGLMMVRDSVILKNLEKKQQLETEELNWTQRDSSIFTKKNVIVRSEDGILYGQGIKTKQSFETYEFMKPHGKINTK